MMKRWAGFGEVMSFSELVNNRTTSDADGNFELPDTPMVEGSTMSAVLLGYEPQSGEIPPGPEPIPIPVPNGVELNGQRGQNLLHWSPPGIPFIW